MIIEQSQQNFEFELKKVSFAELKTIRDACREMAKKGSLQAEKTYKNIESFISEQTV